MFLFLKNCKKCEQKMEMDYLSLHISNTITINSEVIMFLPTNHLSYSLNWFVSLFTFGLGGLVNNILVAIPSLIPEATPISLELQLPEKSELSKICTKIILLEVTFVFCCRF